MEKFILTATTANSWIYPKVKNWAQNSDELIRSAVECYEAGAAIVHVHLPRNAKEAARIVASIRDQCDVVIQAGMSSFPFYQRDSDYDAHPDMLSVIANHHAEHFTQMSVDILHPLDEMQLYCEKCKITRIKPEWEIWHMGSYWNLNYLIEQKLLDPPYILTLFFDWPGGTWSPATADEFYHRIKYMPPESRYTISVMSDQQLKIAALAITEGGNVRTGTEDYPFVSPGVPAKNNKELVAQMISLAKQLGREIADPSDARKILGL